MKKPSLIMMKPKNLKPWEKNPRVNDEAVEQVALSIQKFGFNQPILVNQDNVICAGHTRREAALVLQLDTVPVIKKEMTEAEFMAYNIADNKTGELADWDDDLLKELMLELDELGEPDLPGFDLEELSDLFQDDKEDNSPKSSEGPKKDSKRTSQESTKLVFNCTAKQAMEIDSKLDAIIREQKLDNQVEALLFALKYFKGNPKVKRVKRG